MAVIRLISLLVVLGGLTLLLVQNWSPVLPLVFLGLSSQALPLAIWILMSVAAGVLTSLLIAGVLNLSNYFAHSSRSKPSQVQAEPPRQSAQRSQTSTNPFSFQRETKETKTYDNTSKPDTDSVPDDVFDDWESDAKGDDDWDFEQDTDKKPPFSSPNQIKDSTTYEVDTKPKSGSQSGSVYSYSYREPRNSGVGRTESVYDADYRVIVPPHRQTDPAKEEDDDWGFEDEDDEQKR